MKTMKTIAITSETNDSATVSNGHAYVDIFAHGARHWGAAPFIFEGRTGHGLTQNWTTKAGAVRAAKTWLAKRS